MLVYNFNILGMFHTFNNEYFNGKLPIPKIKTMSSYRILGCFSCKYNEYGKMFNQEIKISDNYDYTENQFRDILVHEMIHYYLAFVGIDVKCTHGIEFIKKCEEFNCLYDMNLTPTIDLTPYKIKKGKSKFIFKLSTMF